MNETKLQYPPPLFQSAESFSRPPAAAGMQKVAAYIRVSTDMADQENSYEAQERYFKHLLEQNARWISAGIYSDHGISGTSHEKRTGFKRLLRHCREGKIDRIICKSISRFARNTRDFMEALNVLKEGNVTILFEKEGLDTANPTSSFILTTLAAVAQEESRSISSNVRWSNEKRYPRGDVANQPIYGYQFAGKNIITKSGYCYRAVEVVPEEAVVVRWIFEQAAAGTPYKQIARDLNRQHVPRKISSYTKKRMESAAKGQLHSNIDEGWTDAQIINIIRNERYTGDVLIQKTYTEDYLTHKIRKNTGEVTQYLVRDHHPAIISRELFEEVKKLWESGSGINKEMYGQHAFSGRLICGCCGRFYHVRNIRKRPIWYCPSTTRNNGKDLCQNGKVYEEHVIRMLKKAIVERFLPAASPQSGTLNIGQPERDLSLSGASAVFVKQMQARLENIQNMDFIERDRAFMKRKLMAAHDKKEALQKQICLLRSRKRSLEVFEHDSAGNFQIAALKAELQIEKEKLAAAEDELKMLSNRLEYLENYWDELEADHEYRDRALEWISGLPAGEDGAMELLDGMAYTYVKAFVLSITIHDPLHCTVHWFDDTRTEIEMYYNKEEFHSAAQSFERQ